MSIQTVSKDGVRVDGQVYRGRREPPIYPLSASLDLSPSEREVYEVLKERYHLSDSEAVAFSMHLFLSLGMHYRSKFLERLNYWRKK